MTEFEVTYKCCSNKNNKWVTGNIRKIKCPDCKKTIKPLKIIKKEYKDEKLLRSTNIGIT